MSGEDKTLQVGNSAVVLVDRIQILSPVAMITTSFVYRLVITHLASMGWIKLTCHDRSNPDGIEAKVADVVQFRLKTLECSTTVVAEIATCSTAVVSVAASNAVSQHKVDATRLPGTGVCRYGDGGDVEDDCREDVEEYHLIEGESSKS
jgi:hypothetical protein